MGDQTGIVCDLGRISYNETYPIQLEVAELVKAGGPPVLLFVEHDPILTLGANFHDENLMLTLPEYAERGIDVVRTDRGGDVTYHGPNQLVIYPIFDVSKFGKDLHRWLRDLEETIIVAIGGLGLDGYRFPPNTGVWVRDKKVAAIGIKISRWVSIHGIAVNCDNDLSPFESIIPCGIHDYGVTSLSNEAGRRITIEDVKPLVVQAFERVFGLTFETADLSELMDEAKPATTP
jgi:lipoyl(octanoyl) transferase